MSDDGLMRIFWPADLVEAKCSGVLVGWRNSPLDVVVVAVLEVGDPVAIDRHLRHGSFFRNAPHSTKRISEHCGMSFMGVLGLVNPTEELAASGGGGGASSSGGEAAGLLTITSSNQPPKSVIVRHSHASSIQFIRYYRPNPTHMQYLSLDPIPLALEGRKRRSRRPDDTLADEVESQERKNQVHQRKLEAKLKLHSIRGRVITNKETMLPRIINQINWSWELEQILMTNMPLLGTRPPKRRQSISEKVADSATTMRDATTSLLWYLLASCILPLGLQILSYLWIAGRVVAEALLRLLEFRVRPGYAAAKDVSAVAQQVEIRLLQFCYWPMQYLTLRQRKSDWFSVTTSHADYIRFFNSLWLVANDVILGMALGSFILERADWTAQTMDTLLYTYTVDSLRRTISWLMGWPAGLKLNNELAAFLGDLFLWVIEYWASCIALLKPAFPCLIWVLGWSSFAGASMPIAMTSDLLSLLTVHVYCFYVASARILHWQLTILTSLFHLFRGKKHNVLRKRIDSCDYDLDQLLVGTILFTLVFFLLPTVGVYYINFTVARLAIISLKALLDTMLACLNHFPLFAIMLRLKDPHRLPGGVQLELHACLSPEHQTMTSKAAAATEPAKTEDRACCGPSSDTKSASTTTTATADTPLSIIQLHSVPLAFRDIFDQYFQMALRIRRHYYSPRVILYLATGQFIPPLDRRSLYSLQYSMLPTRRATVAEVWEAIKATIRPGASAAGASVAGASTATGKRVSSRSWRR